MKALVINCTLKGSPEPSHTDSPASVVADRLVEQGVEVSFPERGDVMLSERSPQAAG
ncbi:MULTISPECIES: hypothetical protein [unclassified Streptomyces]|uniref:hypothetical protein n=1 Tax=unclassified Streptomyces TaxID=2593676 RepID=UPI000B12B84F|nr:MULTISPECIES: hypothetical protein [unclassified Streptomyces]